MQRVFQPPLGSLLQTGEATPPAVGGFFKDDQPSTKLIRLRDRVFIGAAADHNGRRTAPLGNTWLTLYGANYFEKNSQAIILGTTRAGLTVGAFTDIGQTSTVHAGLMAVSVNQGEASYGRAVYAECFHKGNATGTVGIEIQCGNYTGVKPSCNAYLSSHVAGGLYIAAVAGNGYVLGDNNTPGPVATMPCAMGIDVGGGDLGTSWQRFTVGLLFRDGALYRGTDGLTGTAAAISMAQQHEIRWEASSTLRGAVLRSDVTAVAGQDVGIIFSNTQAKIGGTGERAIALFKDDIAGAGAVNWLTFTNARTNVPPRISTDGSDTNVPLDIQTKGQAITRFQSHAGSGENLRITPPVTAPVNYLTVTGAGAGSPPKFSVAGPDTNIDLWIGGKGTGVLRFGALTATADAPITGYVTIKLDNGATCKLASIA